MRGSTVNGPEVSEDCTGAAQATPAVFACSISPDGGLSWWRDGREN